MLLTLTTTHRPATDLGFLLHKHPGRVLERGLPFGRATVFYPEATLDTCTAALLLEVDPVALSRTTRPGEGAPLEPYVNDRPYAAGSFLAVALRDAFGTAMLGGAPPLVRPVAGLAAGVCPAGLVGGMVDDHSSSR